MAVYLNNNSFIAYLPTHELIRESHTDFLWYFRIKQILNVNSAAPAANFIRYFSMSKLIQRKICVENIYIDRSIVASISSPGSGRALYVDKTIFPWIAGCEFAFGIEKNGVVNDNYTPITYNGTNVAHNLANTNLFYQQSGFLPVGLISLDCSQHNYPVNINYPIYLFDFNTSVGNTEKTMLTLFATSFFDCTDDLIIALTAFASYYSANTPAISQSSFFIYYDIIFKGRYV